MLCVNCSVKLSVLLADCGAVLQGMRTAAQRAHGSVVAENRPRPSDYNPGMTYEDSDDEPMVSTTLYKIHAALFPTAMVPLTQRGWPLDKVLVSHNS